MEIYSLILWLLGLILGIFIFYLVIKKAIVNGIRDSGILESKDNSISGKKSEEDLLKYRYENGEISFETYVQEWKKLNKLA